MNIGIGICDYNDIDNYSHLVFNTDIVDLDVCRKLEIISIILAESKTSILRHLYSAIHHRQPQDITLPIK